MEQYSLQALLDSDREMILSNLGRDRSPSAAQGVLEKAVDRTMYRYVEQCQDARLRDEAQYLLQSIRNTLPIIDVVAEAREWKKTVEDVRSRSRPRPAALGLFSAGALLVLASVLAMLVGGSGGIFSFAKVLLPVLLGIGATFWAGTLTAKPKKRRVGQAEAQVRTEFLVDAEKAFHCLRCAMVMADHQLETIRQEAAAQRQKSQESDAANVLSAKELDLFAELLESSYAADGAAARESVSSIRFFLHNAGIEVLDCEPGRESWFEFLPAQGQGTLRPALVREGKLLKKGLASARRD